MIWKEKYTLGIARIDEQHKELFHRVGDFVKTLRSSASWEEKVKKVNETLEFMNGYVVEHFKDEEEYQKEIGFPGYEAHKKVHDNMVSYILEVTEEYEKSGYHEQLVQQLGGKLLSWLINHVAAQDQEIATYAIEKGVVGDGR